MKSGWIYVAVGGLLIAGLFLLFRNLAPGPQETAAPAVAPPAGSAPASPQAAPVPMPRVFELVVKDKAIVSGPAVIKVSEGDEVVIRITSDRADELHLHGYDLHAHLKPGETAALTFKADRTGRFEYELHTAHVDLGALEVYPK